MDYYKQFQEHNRVAVFELKGEVETRLRPYWYAQNTLMGSLFRGRLPANWREQWRATCAEQAEQGIITDPKSIQEIEDYLEAWAKFCGLEPLQKQPTSTAAQTRPTPAPQEKKTSGHRPGKKRVSPREALFFRHLARAQRYLDEIEAAIASLGAKIDAAHVGEEVDATPDVDRVEDLIWSYNDAIESARETWLRENLSGALNERLLSLNTPVKYGMPLYTDEAQERRAMLQGLEISRRLMGRNAVMDRIVATMQTIEIAGDVAGIALGAGAVITIVKKGGKWALVKTVIRGVVVDAAARAAERALEEAGVDQATLGGAKFAATLIKLILRRRIRAVGNGETPPPQRPPKAPPNPSRDKSRQSPQADAVPDAKSPPHQAHTSNSDGQSTERVTRGTTANHTFSKSTDKWTATNPKGTRYNYEIVKRNDIDWNRVRRGGDRRAIGMSNADAAQKFGVAPELNDGSFATLHHVGQDARGPLVEASTRYHGVGKSGQSALHSQFGKNNPHPTRPIDRRAFDVDTREYWQWRVENQ